MGVLGYNIAFKIGDKVILGTTQDEIGISKTIKESITKGDKGQTQSQVTGYTATFSSSGEITKRGADAAAGLDSDDMFGEALKVGEAAIVDFVYHRGEGLKSYKGKAVMVDYKETSGSEDTANWSASWKINGSLEEVNA